MPERRGGGRCTHARAGSPTARAGCRACPGGPRCSAARPPRCWRAAAGSAARTPARPFLTGGATLPLPRPNNPVTWPTTDNKPIASGLQPETGRHPADLQLGRLRQPGLPEPLRQEVQLQGRRDHVQHDGRGHLQAAQRAEVRRVHGRHRRRAGPAGRVEADPAAEPQLHPEHRPGLAGLHQPVLRPGLAVHRPVHDLHDGHLLAQGPGPREPVHDEERVRDAVAAQVQGQGRDPGRLPRGHQPRADEERHLQPQHHQPVADRPGPAARCRSWSSQVNVQIDNNDYTEIPNGQTWIHHAWSGDMAAAAVLHAQGHAGRGRRVLVPHRRPRPGGQRHQHGAALGHQPGAGPPVPELHARPAQRAGEHQLQRLHAAAERRSPRSGWSRRSSCRPA